MSEWERRIGGEIFHDTEHGVGGGVRKGMVDGGVGRSLNYGRPEGQ